MLIHKLLYQPDEIFLDYYNDNNFLYHFLKTDRKYYTYSAILISEYFFNNALLNSYLYYGNLYYKTNKNNITWVGSYNNIYILITNEIKYNEIYISDNKETLFNYKRILKIKSIFD